MKKNIIYNLLGLFVLLFAFTACEFETAEQDPSDIISPNNNPTVTVTSNNASGTVEEGETVVYTITFDKPIERAVTFTPTIVSGTNDHDFELDAVTLAPYTTSVQLPIAILEDYLIEGQENLSVQIEISSIAEKNLVHPDTAFAPIDLTINDFVDDNKLVVNFSWAEDIDFDILVFSDTATYPATLWGTGGATGANPEIDTSIWLDDPAGDYYVCILDWWEGINFDYTFDLAFPDGSVQTITGTFDGTNYPYTSFTGPSSWGSPSAYKVLKVVVNGTNFVVTKL